MALSAGDKKRLLCIARETIETYLRGGDIPRFEDVSAALLEKGRGVFVSLHKGKELRGCIGVFTSDKALCETVSQMAIEASTKDPRFDPVTSDELKNTSIEISVLTPLKRVEDTDDIVVGRDGIYIIKGYRRGVLLPQVAVDYGWNREQFLSQTCLKAGLNPDCWKDKDIDIYTFEAEVFGEDKGEGGRVGNATVS